jgi:2',3'-cyclic-nucleotide 2'-phosphodiesterase (5'-nucleotidase family)
VLLDVGNIAKGATPYDLTKLGYILDGMWAMGYDAVNLGEREASLDREELKRLAASGRLPLVSCNVVDERTKKPIVAPYRIVRVKSHTIAIVGLTDAPDRAGQGVAVVDWEPIVDGIVKQLRPKCDAIILLAAVHDSKMDWLARRFPTVDCILGGSMEASWESAFQVGRVTLFSIGEEGKVVGRLRATWTRGKGFQVLSAEPIRLVPSIPGHPALLQVVNAYKLGIREFSRRATPGGQRAASVRNDHLVGSMTCKRCHAAAYQAWMPSAHAHAFKSLEEHGYGYDPGCLSCHTTGYGAQGGFASSRATPRLAAVSCEECHGRGSSHAYAGGTRPHFAPVTEKTCRRCHDRDNSPGFQLESYLAKIRHW